uniref:Uncharacterized protein n=1 Tax=Arundo donax TaxID=35708 RepID=A0A0A8Z3W2_ARUDO
MEATNTHTQHQTNNKSSHYPKMMRNSTPITI